MNEGSKNHIRLPSLGGWYQHQEEEPILHLFSRTSDIYIQGSYCLWETESPLLNLHIQIHSESQGRGNSLKRMGHMQSRYTVWFWSIYQRYRELEELSLGMEGLVGIVSLYLVWFSPFPSSWPHTNGYQLLRTCPIQSAHPGQHTREPTQVNALFPDQWPEGHTRQYPALEDPAGGPRKPWSPPKGLPTLGGWAPHTSILKIVEAGITATYTRALGHTPACSHSHVKPFCQQGLRLTYSVSMPKDIMPEP